MKKAKNLCWFEIPRYGDERGRNPLIVSRRIGPIKQVAPAGRQSILQRPHISSSGATFHKFQAFDSTRRLANLQGLERNCESELERVCRVGLRPLPAKTVRSEMDIKGVRGYLWRGCPSCRRKFHPKIRVIKGRIALKGFRYYG